MALRFKTVDMTPKQAEKLLRHNDVNRRISQQRVKSYAADMKNGDWRLNPQPIVLNGETLLDGQHRLRAVIDADMAVPMVVCVGAGAEVQEVLDQGRVRSVADVLKLKGARATTRVAACARTTMMLRSGEYMSRVTAAQAVREIDRCRPAYEWLAGLPTKRGVTRAGALGIAPWIWTSFPELTAEFFDAFIDGSGLERGQPQFWLREYLLTTRDSSLVVTMKTLTAARYWFEGDRLDRVHTSTAGYDYFAHQLGQKIDLSDYIHRRMRRNPLPAGKRVERTKVKRRR